MKSNKGIWVALIAVAIIAIVGLVNPAQGIKFQGVTNYDEVDATAIKIGGSSGSRLGPIISSTCSLIANSFTVAASTTVAMDCAVTGVVAGDIVFAQFASSSPIVGNGWAVDQVSASSTSGFITLLVTNNVGASAVMPASIASTTRYLVLHPRSTVPGL